jgi:hypothetical protein
VNNGVEEEAQMIRKRFAGTVLRAVVTCAVVSAQSWASVPDGKAKVTEANEPAATADLRILEFVFTADNDKAVRVHIVNTGGAVSSLCILRLTVRKIDGVPVGRVTEVKLPPLGAGKHKWLVINAKSILPNHISLESTTFKLNADATSILAESDEANNEVWHNL